MCRTIPWDVLTALLFKPFDYLWCFIVSCFLGLTVRLACFLVPYTAQCHRKDTRMGWVSPTSGSKWGRLQVNAEINHQFWELHLSWQVLSCSQGNLGYFWGCLGVLSQVHLCFRGCQHFAEARSSTMHAGGGLALVSSAFAPSGAGVSQVPCLRLKNWSLFRVSLAGPWRMLTCLSGCQFLRRHAPSTWSNERRPKHRRNTTHFTTQNKFQLSVVEVWLFGVTSTQAAFLAAILLYNWRIRWFPWWALPEQRNRLSQVPDLATQNKKSLQFEMTDFILCLLSFPLIN